MKKITIELDLTELYSEGENFYNGETVSDLITGEVKSQLKRELIKDARVKFGDKFHEELVEHLGTDEIIQKIKTRVDRNIDSGALVIRNKTLFSYVNTQIEKYMDSRAGESFVEKTVDKAFANLKETYNEQFAIGIIAKLNENNLLTPEAQGLLFANQKKNEEV